MLSAPTQASVMVGIDAIDSEWTHSHRKQLRLHPWMCMACSQEDILINRQLCCSKQDLHKP